MKLLYIIPSFQHPNVRGPNRHYHLVRDLAERHEITLLVLNRSVVGPEAVEEMRSYVEQLHIVDVQCSDSKAGLCGHIPVTGKRMEQSLRFRNAVQRMKAICSRLLAENTFELIVFHGKSIFPVIEDCRDLPIVVDFCDATSMRIRNELRYAGMARRLWLWLRYTEIRRVEKNILRKTPHVAFIARRDRDAILGPNSHGEILPNGVDHGFWRRQSPQSDQNRIVFSGVMNYAPNNDAALFLIDRIAPRIRETIPGLEIVVVGRDPTDALKERVARTPNLKVTGFVDDVRPYLEGSALFAGPLRYASGTQNKVLEAMAMEMPVVTTSIVADGLRMDDAGEPPVLVADNEAGFAQAIVRLLTHPAERSSLAARGREYVENHFIWSRSAEKLEKMCLSALGAEQPRSKHLMGVTS